MSRRIEANEYIKQNESQALSKASAILGRDIKQSNFSGIIGGKNATFFANPLDYNTSDTYVISWFKNFKGKYEFEKNSTADKSSHRINQLINDEFLKKYIFYYLTRIYYRKHDKNKGY